VFMPKYLILKKIECRNHLLRNLRTKLNNLITNKIKKNTEYRGGRYGRQYYRR
jgi:hypothetical protein